MEQREQTARIPRHGDVFAEIRAALLLEPALAAELTDEETGASRDVAQLVLVDVLALKGRVRELLLQTAAQHGIERILRYLQFILIGCVQHIERIGVECAVRRGERRKQLVRHGFKKFHSVYPPAECAARRTRKPVPARTALLLYIIRLRARYYNKKTPLYLFLLYKRTDR